MASATTSRLDNAWIPSNGDPSLPSSHMVFAQPIEQSPQDDRTYRLIRLPNNLQALLISDPTTDKAAASLSVGVGHLSDPDDRPGLAHFCEHLLFMGTKQYPKENEYGEYVAQNGGRTNAYTSTNNTNYYFSVSATGLRGALDRFSAFFHSPLFSPSCTVRELQAVDSENKKNQQSDMWRVFQLDKGLSKEGTRWAKFGSGNWKSLMHTEREIGNEAEKSEVETDLQETPNDDGGDAGRQVRSVLLDWYGRHYSANRMTLAVYGKESLEDLATMVTELFSPIPDRNLPAPLTNTSSPPVLNSPWGSAQEGTTIFVKTVMEFRALELRWVVPFQGIHYRQKTLRLLTHLLGHEGEGSICSVLKKKGWLTELSASKSSGDAENGFDFVRVGMVLTQDGLDHYNSVLQTVYDYITLLKSHPSPFPDYHYNELRTISSTAFRFADKTAAEGYVTALAENLAKPLARTDILAGNSLVYEPWNPKAEHDFRTIVGKYLNPEQARVTLMCRDDWDRVDAVKGEQWEKEKWYGTEYMIRKTRIDAENTVPGLALPAPNTFIPTRFDIEKREISEPLKRPLKIRETALSTLWHKKDDQFWVPRASFTFMIRSPLASVTPRHSVMTRLFTELFTDALTERTYDADIAGMSYSLSTQLSGVSLSIAGYSDKLAVLLKTILSDLKSFIVDSDRLFVQKEQLRQEWQNTLLEQPYHLTEVRTGQILRERTWGEQERLDELQFISVEDVQRHISSLLSRTYTEALVHGNVRKDDALLVIKQFEEIMGSRSLTPAERISTRSLVLPPGGNFIYDAPVPNKDDVNSGMTYYCQIGDNTDERLRATLHLLAQIAKEPAFNQLRTKEQLGYIVASGYWTFTGTMGFKVTIQSERDPIYLETRVDAFLETLRATIAGMSDVEFNKERQSLIDKKTAKIKNLYEEGNRFVRHIEDGYFDFMQRDKETALLKTLTKDEVLSLLVSHVHPESQTRSKISVHMRSQTAPSPRVSHKAAEVLLKHFSAAGLPMQVEAYNAAAKMQLSVAINQSVWARYFEKDMPDFDKNVAQELVRMIATVAKQHPVEEEATPRLRPGAIYIDNISALKARLTLGKAAIPVETYSDFGSKL